MRAGALRPLVGSAYRSGGCKPASSRARGFCNGRTALHRRYRLACSRAYGRPYGMRLCFVRVLRRCRFALRLKFALPLRRRPPLLYGFRRSGMIATVTVRRSAMRSTAGLRALGRLRRGKKDISRRQADITSTITRRSLTLGGREDAIGASARGARSTTMRTT